MKKIFLFLLIILVGSCKQEETFQHSIDQIFTVEFRDDAPGGAVMIIKNDSIVFAKWIKNDLSQWHSGWVLLRLC